MHLLPKRTSSGKRNGLFGRRRQRGSGVVDFAIVLPVFALATIGVFDFGRGLWTYNTIGNLARDATRYAAVRSAKSEDPSSQDKIAAHVVSQLDGLDPDRLTVTADWLPTNAPGSVVEVRLTYNFDPFTPFVPSALTHLTSRSRMTIAY
jgi:Flp pilus assembly protein TadG